MFTAINGTTYLATVPQTLHSLPLPTASQPAQSHQQRVTGLAKGTRGCSSAGEAGEATTAEETALNARRLVRKLCGGSKRLTAYTDNYKTTTKPEGATLTPAEKS